MLFRKAIYNICYSDKEGEADEETTITKLKNSSFIALSRDIAEYNRKDKMRNHKESKKEAAAQIKQQPQKAKSFIAKAWYFLWEDDSILSWIVNIILAFLIIKFLVYPGLGAAFQTTHPVVAVVSTSMEHNAAFGQWIEQNSGFYGSYKIYDGDFEKFPFRNGFNKGDIMILFGNSLDKIKIGDIIVFNSNRPYPIIHRVIKEWNESDGYHFQTKGDNNPDSIVRYINISSFELMNPAYKNAKEAVKDLDETDISENEIVGRAVFRIPYLGWIKIGAVAAYQAVVDAIKAIA